MQSLYKDILAGCSVNIDSYLRQARLDLCDDEARYAAT